MPTCNKSEGKMYKCPKCLPPNGLLCEECYKEGNHHKHEGAGHEESYRGSCDCGNHYYMNRESACKNHPITNGGTCGNRRGKLYRCSCMKQSNSLLCEHCLKEGHHSGHNHNEVDSWGSCDCGNDYYIPESSWCKEHPGYAELTGRCWYKSGWLEQDGHGASRLWGAKHKRWFQCRHSSMYYYEEKQSGYNWSDPGTPKSDDAEACLHLPELSALVPSIHLPSLHLPSMPSLSMPSMPSLSMPSLSMPSLHAPSLSAASLSALKPKKRQKNPLGMFQLGGTKCKRSGKTVTLSNVTYERYWEEAANKTETIKGATFVLHCPNDEQAESWQETLVYGGSEKQ